jgi:hypothetical protein
MSTIAAAPALTSARTGVRRPVRPSGSESGPVRLTRRGRLVVLALFVALCFGVFSMFGGQSAATGESGEPVQTRTVMIERGDTLWGIAQGIAEPGEVRQMIYQIQELNALSGASLQQGQEIVVPVG